MKALKTLIKLASAEVDEKQRALREQQNREDAVRAALSDLEAELVAEQRQTPSLDEAAHSYGPFGAAALRRRNVLQQELASAGAAVATARDDLAVSFERQKRYEITDEARRRRNVADTLRREGIDADERSLQRHRRGRG